MLEDIVDVGIVGGAVYYLYKNKDKREVLRKNIELGAIVMCFALIILKKSLFQKFNIYMGRPLKVSAPILTVPVS